MAYIPGKKRHEKEEPGRSDDTRLDLDLNKLKKAYLELEEAHRELKDSHTEMILNLAVAAECRDEDTGGHILRISDYAVEVAREIGLPEEDTEILRYASPMHDIGKIAIPDAVLKKPGKLTPAEWEVMKTHTLIGAKIFQNSRSPVLRAASEIALTHHEKFDGTGYPRGLKGEAIPLFGRITAMVDVFDAVLSKRCYKAASTFDEAFAYIQSLAGTHLDPKLVAAFVRIKDKIVAIYEANTTIQHFVNDFGTL
jgi:putative two-component system response regulator